MICESSLVVPVIGAPTDLPLATRRAPETLTIWKICGGCKHAKFCRPTDDPLMVQCHCAHHTHIPETCGGPYTVPTHVKENKRENSNANNGPGVGESDSHGERAVGGGDGVWQEVKREGERKREWA